MGPSSILWDVGFSLLMWSICMWSSYLMQISLMSFTEGKASISLYLTKEKQTIVIKTYKLMERKLIKAGRIAMMRYLYAFICFHPDVSKKQKDATLRSFSRNKQHNILKEQRCTNLKQKQLKRESMFSSLSQKLLQQKEDRIKRVRIAKTLKELPSIIHTAMKPMVLDHVAREINITAQKNHISEDSAFLYNSDVQKNATYLKGLKRAFRPITLCNLFNSLWHHIRTL